MRTTCRNPGEWSTRFQSLSSINYRHDSSTRRPLWDGSNRKKLNEKLVLLRVGQTPGRESVVVFWAPEFTSGKKGNKSKSDCWNVIKKAYLTRIWKLRYWLEEEEEAPDRREEEFKTSSSCRKLKVRLDSRHSREKRCRIKHLQTPPDQFGDASPPHGAPLALTGNHQSTQNFQ